MRVSLQEGLSALQTGASLPGQEHPNVGSCRPSSTCSLPGPREDQDILKPILLFVDCAPSTPQVPANSVPQPSSQQAGTSQET